jgi:hypothetical protein
MFVLNRKLRPSYSSYKRGKPEMTIFPGEMTTIADCNFGHFTGENSHFSQVALPRRCVPV